MRHSQSVELGRAQAVYLCWDRLSTILHESPSHADVQFQLLYDEVEEVVEGLFKYVKDYTDAHPILRDEIVAGAKGMGGKL